MSKFTIGERVDGATEDHEGGTVIAVFPTVDGRFRYAVDMEGTARCSYFQKKNSPSTRFGPSEGR